MNTYTITFFDKSFVAVDETVAKGAIHAMNTGIKNIQIGGNMYAVSGISKIEKNKDQIAGPDKDYVQIEGPDNPVRKETLERMKKELAEKFGWK